MRTSYGERNYAYGASMLTLRTTIGLTQAELADKLGVSRRAVGEWEAGKSYPKAEHLKEFIALAVQKKAFAAGREAEEIRTFWKGARQKVLLDEHWLSELLSQHCTPLPYVVPSSDVPAAVGDVGGGKAPTPRTRPPVPMAEASTTPPVVPRPASGPRVDWGDALAVPFFYGREQELTLLAQWIAQEHCRVVSVLGMGGIGKSALTVSIMYRLAEYFEVVIFRSLRDAPSCESLLDDCLQVLRSQPLSTLPTTLEQRISLLLEQFRQVRVLVVFDNLEGLLEEGDVQGHLRSGFEGYGQLLHRVAETGHQSCLLLTSREKTSKLRPLESKRSLVRSLRLTGLDSTACKHLFLEKGLLGTEEEQEQLIEVYGGNPLALKIVAETIIDLFGGEIGEFLAGGPVLFGSITELLDEQFARLSVLEQSVFRWLAIVREPVTLDELLALLVIPLSRAQVLEAVDAGYRRSLIESAGKRAGCLTLQSVMLEYVTSILITEATNEIQRGRLDHLIQHGLELAHCKEDVRQTQARLLVAPLLAALQSEYQKRASMVGQVRSTVPAIPVERLLLNLLDQSRAEADYVQGYGPANLIALLRLLREHLSGLDLSHLCIRGAYLQGVEMHDTSLAGSLICDTVFTEAICITSRVAISLDGKLWATGGMHGKVSIWKDGGQILHLVWQAHSDMVLSLAISPNGRTLASGSLDGAIRLWNTESGALLWNAWQNGPQCLAFSPDSSLLASGGLDTTVQLRDPLNGTSLQTLPHPDYVFAVAFSPDGSLLASGCFDGKLRLWQRQNGFPPHYTLILSAQMSGEAYQMTNLAFAPDGRTMASVNRGQAINLWEVESLRLLRSLQCQTNCMKRVAWSPDGRALASICSDQSIWLWDVEQDRYRAILRGHTADIYDIAFVSDTSYLFSCSADNTLRVWDTQNGQCVRVIQGYSVSLYDIDWSLDGTQLVSAGSDGLVMIWDVDGQKPPRTLHGHDWIVRGVRWSPDGKLLASSGWDTRLHLWDTTSGTCVQTFQDSSTPLEYVAWNPDGSLLACGTCLRGIQVWDVKARKLRWCAQTGLTIGPVAWSPDGTRLLGGGADGNVYLWEAVFATGEERRGDPLRSPTAPTKLVGHHGQVQCAVWSPDGTRLASSGYGRGNGELFVWDIQSLRGDKPLSLPPQTFIGHPCAVYALTWNPNGEQLICGGCDGKLRWWDVQSGKCVMLQAGHHEAVRSLRISPDGQKLASCGDDGAIMLWDLHTSKHLQTLRRDRPYERLNITDIRGLTETQKTTLQALGAS